VSNISFIYKLLQRAAQVRLKAFFGDNNLLVAADIGQVSAMFA